MLDVETRRRIDTARDILVGKVPDPKSQVEQITIALIYKFMDDIDAESEELGGRRTFFAGEFARYGWAKLMRSGLGGHETLNLYAEAITRMPENPGIPQLFRAIFDNAYLPYRDPETLRAFLKVIDEFVYDHSERLGDAFEYLLSVLGSQGDAGQFRTPRHIIDFMVSIVDPKKDEVVLDPACGTAGFLISSYKHILNANEDGSGSDDFSASGLTPEEKGRLAGNFSGYDISPDMVRLSLVNLYLHGFRDPHIHEYDTLTSEDRWNEYADVILANPPFMSPKGGIRPHNRFSVKSKRSEVLFVDYMAEHLTPAGRAGIIVPEGIVFQSQNAHRRLRKMLVEDYLVAVVSLPAGVFQPYSGVKTSILILDKALAKRTDRIAFFKVENDGFDLGAQRRPIEKDDLPETAEGVTEYLADARAGVGVDGGAPAESALPVEYPLRQVAEDAPEYRADRTMDRLVARGTAIVVAKEDVAANGEYSLNGERYREVMSVTARWPLVKLRDVCDKILSGGTPSTKIEEYWRGDIPWITSADIVDIKTATPRKYITERAIRESATNLIEKGNIVVVTRVGLGKLFKNDYDVCISQDSQGLILRQQVDADYLVYVLRDVVEEFKKVSQGSTIQGVTKKQLSELQFPLPPLEAQKEIVAEIEGYQKVIDGARAVVDNYRPHIAIDPDWPEVELGDVCEVKGGKRLPRGTSFSNTPTKHPYIRVVDFRDRTVHVDSVRFISQQIHQQIARYTISSDDVYISIAGTIGMMGTVPRSLSGANLTENAARLMLDGRRVNKRFLAIVGSGEFAQAQVRSLTHAVGVPKLALRRIKTLRIPIPPVDIQKKIVAEIEEEEGLVAGNRELIRRFEKKIQAAIARVWGED